MRRTLAVLTGVAVAGPLALVAAAPAAASGCTAVTDRWEAIDLGFYGSATNLNNLGQVVGFARTGWSDDRAFLWQDGTVRDLPGLGGSRGRAEAVDDQGDVTGTASTSTDRTRAALWRDGAVTDLGTLGGFAAFPTSVANGTVVGAALVSTATGSERQAVVWRDGQVTSIPAARGSEATDVNEAGQVVGYHRMRAGYTSPYQRTDRAFLWSDGRLTELGTLGGNWSQALAVNDRGQVLGRSALSADGVYQAGFVWSAGTGLRRIADGSGLAVPEDLNDSGVIVGSYSCTTAYGEYFPAVWTSADRLPLRLPDVPGTVGVTATAVNDRGDIVGIATRDQRPRAILWRPKATG